MQKPDASALRLMRNHINRPQRASVRFLQNERPLNPFRVPPALVLDALKTEWTNYNDGKEAGKAIFELKRKK
jgi:hypothetical protein